MKEYVLSFQKNIRDLGGLVGYQGKKVKNNRLIRGGFLEKITPEDAKILKSLNLTDIIDFRSSSEFVNRPDYRLENVKYHNFPPLDEKWKEEDKDMSDGNLLWFVDEGNSGFDHMIKTYRDVLSTERGVKAYRDFFKLLLSKEDGVFYFHCSQGKDRAGLAAAMLELALGVDLEVIKEDYLRSNVAMEIRFSYLVDKVKDRPYFNEEYLQSMHDVFTANILFLEEGFKTMTKLAGSPLEYIKNVLNVDIEKLRQMYLE